MSHAAKLRQMMAAGNLVVAPGAFDGVTAKLVRQAGFSAVYMTGSGTAATIGYPDYGLVGLTEMASNAGRIVDATDMPVIADADTGYGNELNVTRTVREYERLGVAAIHIEDQTFPKKCGHLENKSIIGRSEYLSKIAAAARARRTRDFVVIARTDSRAVAGFDEAIARANAALEAGADVAFVEAPETMEEVKAVPQLVRGPCLMNVVRGGKSPMVQMDDLQAMGYRIAIVPGMLMLQLLGACEAILAEFKRLGRHPETIGNITIADSYKRMDVTYWDDVANHASRDPSLLTGSIGLPRAPRTRS
jgi:2-methylisocitrate lyase-like PEP mutase family enzyme